MVTPITIQKNEIYKFEKIKVKVFDIVDKKTVFEGVQDRLLHMT